MFDLLNIKPHKVSRDLSGYITFIYGAPKTGKTTLATQIDKCLLLAFEKGYNAIPGVIAQDVNSWGEMKQICKELKKDEVKANFKTIIIDTVDIAADMCNKFICSQFGVDAPGDVPYGKAWQVIRKELEETFRSLTMLGYAIFFISHRKEASDEDNNKVIAPSISGKNREIFENMADIYGYAHQKRTEDGKTVVVLTVRDPDCEIICGSRFKYIDSEIIFDYEHLTEALNKAIDKESEIHGSDAVTIEKEKVSKIQEYDFDKLMIEFNTIANSLMEKSQDYGPKITTVIDRYLGRGKKVVDATPDQAELIFLINKDLTEDYLNKK